MLPLVSTQRREQALRYKHTLGQFCCLKSWLMLYEMLDEREKGLMDEWEYNEYGKPSFHLSPLTFHLYFSISHCKAGIAVAIDDQPIGIDIESIRHAHEDIIERTMNAAERAGMDDRKFTRLWTQKEAFVKRTGEGIARGLSSLDFAPYDGLDRFAAYDCRFSVFRLCGAVMTACGDTQAEPPRQVTQEMLVHMLLGKNDG